MYEGGSEEGREGDLLLGMRFTFWRSSMDETLPKCSVEGGREGGKERGREGGREGGEKLNTPVYRTWYSHSHHVQ